MDEQVIKPQVRSLTVGETPTGRLSHMLAFMTEAMELYPGHDPNDRVIIMASETKTDQDQEDSGLVIEGYVLSDSEDMPSAAERFDGSVKAIADMLGHAAALALSVGLEIEFHPEVRPASDETMARVALSQTENLERVEHAKREPRPFLPRGGSDADDTDDDGDRQ